MEHAHRCFPFAIVATINRYTCHSLLYHSSSLSRRTFYEPRNRALCLSPCDSVINFPVLRPSCHTRAVFIRESYSDPLRVNRFTLSTFHYTSYLRFLDMAAGPFEPMIPAYSKAAICRRRILFITECNPSSQLHLRNLKEKATQIIYGK